jgi:thiosulfate dehydrogenase [quinone] large subunit
VRAQEDLLASRERERGLIRTPIVLTLLLRLVPGYLFLAAGIGKLQSGWLGGRALETTVETWLAKGGMYTWYGSFLQDTVLPNQDLFSSLVVIGEVVVGGLLLLGFLVRPASLVAVFMVLNFLLAQGHPLVGFNVESLLLVILITALLVNPGRSLGIDGFLYERLRLPTWLI